MLAGLGSGNAFRVALELALYGTAVQKAAYSVTRHYGQLLTTRVKAKASGRPGPNAPTGEYRRSIHLLMDRGPLGVTAYVGTNAPQGRRLEFGFVGADSLGRHYNQPPYPHFGPALDEIGPLYQAAVTTAVLGTPMGPKQ